MGVFAVVVAEPESKGRDGEEQLLIVLLLLLFLVKLNEWQVLIDGYGELHPLME